MLLLGLYSPEMVTGYSVRKVKKLNPEDRTITENIHELDLLSLIKNYEDKKEYRSAIRYQFLYLLKLMTDKNMLEWDPEKTNRDYVRMLSGNALQSDFQKLSFVFENVWYGERTIGENEYTIFRKQYQQTQQKNMNKTLKLYLIIFAVVIGLLAVLQVNKKTAD